MHRRQFLSLTAQAAALAAIAPRSLAQEAPGDIAALYRRALVVDTLCAPFSTDAFPPTADALAEIRSSGITAINTTISERTYDGTIEGLARIHSIVER